MPSLPAFAEKRRLAYVTKQAPFGREETFVLQELLALQAQGWELHVFPLRPGASRTPFHQAAEPLIALSDGETLLSSRVLRMAWRWALLHPRQCWGLLRQMWPTSPSGFKTFVKNLTVLPKGIYVGLSVRSLGIRHIHGHWFSTPGTMAWIAAEVSGASLSLTGHANDLYVQNNLLGLKLRACRFAVTISEANRQFLTERHPEAAHKIHRLYLGVRCAVDRPPVFRQSFFQILTLANLVPKKGHKIVALALSRLKEEGILIRWAVWGDGPEKKALCKLIRHLGLEDQVDFRPRVPHQEVLSALRSGAYHCMVLPCVQLNNGDRDGIPVALMEAMAAGLPVITTGVSGIGELVRHERTGILVPAQDPAALAEAIHRLQRNRELLEAMAYQSLRQIQTGFSLEKNVAALATLFHKVLEPPLPVSPEGFWAASTDVPASEP